METRDSINKLGNKKQSLWLIVLRGGLGLCLFIKGFIFIKNTSLLEQLISEMAMAKSISGLSTIIPWVHLLGGVMIGIGLFTRLAALLQMPIILGAVFFVNAKNGIFAGQSDLLFSILILLLLFFFVFEGGGSFSLDNYLRNPKKNVS